MSPASDLTTEASPLPANTVYTAGPVPGCSCVHPQRSGCDLPVQVPVNVFLTSDLRCCCCCGVVTGGTSAIPTHSRVL